tara:strand:- start:2293 stop:2430 length:138 start_codon:yes stop_codon:yes gene_type:complete
LAASARLDADRVGGPLDGVAKPSVRATVFRARSAAYEDIVLVAEV